MEYRLIRENEIDTVIKLIDKVVKECVCLDFEIERKSDFYLNKYSLTYVCLDDNKIVGMVSLTNGNYLNLLFVDKEYRRRGIGKKLVEIIDNLVLEDLEVNVGAYAKSFFEHIGFSLKVDFEKKDTYSMIKKRYVEKKFSNYDEVVEFINGQKDRVYSLDNFRNYMENLGNPQLILDCVHIGGTNGKGSTTNYIKEVLKQAGYKVATFTSPALYSRLDIIRINDQFIDEQTMVNYANRYVDLWLKYEISMFEIEVFIAIMYFIEQKVDIALFEVGLGGLLDATNIIMPKLAINTNIGLDHVYYLGHDYQSIALNKAGIVKEGIDYLTGETKPECLVVFEKVCQEKHSTLLTLAPITNIIDGNNVSYRYRNYDIILDTPALYQIYNSALALEALLYLKEHQIINFSDDDLLQGMYNARWAGRFEIVNIEPLIIIDGAHNKEGIDAFYECAKKYDKIKIIFSALRDKDYKHMIEKLLSLTDDITICEFEHVRASDAKTLADGFNVKIEPDYKVAIDDAFSHDGTVFVTGSLYFISKVREYIVKKLSCD
ncbi:GNAT family N-acetyltransferase [Thomasclavelia cocleata]|uniref:tetrahydrofolate synthase n=1 Tax=Thomasclavelia cocleata TaxID=69824 RepID=A0A1I0GBQ6_9FIRM|nr:GNAT family N-acetyltransferase [Thomasclavelia cocleata]MCR1960936.1 GNAT family N-acetyltransferase [Thomasclavelia cocleata]NDO43393.1 GNAT family N-acetyltransferase [Thomasclavelia cocleata]PJN79653.1 GNAT family N-acetyltransferase [Thomasclavelia cocleata]SET67443.1 dihydrofolate synthase / folylpolyglutamate synthase [Thomasclavelia cocleata]